MTANKARQDRQRAYVPLYTYTHTLVPLSLYPWHPMPTTYIHTCIDTFVYLFIYLIVFVFVYLIVFVSLTLLFSLILSSPVLSLPLGKACPWAGGSRPYLYCVCKYLVLFNYYPAVYMYGMVCMYLNVLYSGCVCIIYYTCIQQMYVCT